MTQPPAPLVFTARPRPRRPVVVDLSSASLLVLIGAALAQRSYLFAALLAVAAVVPWSAREWQRQLGVVLAFLGALLAALGIFLVPLSARVTALYLPGLILFFLRAITLNGEAARRFVDRRFLRGTTAKVFDVNETLDAALQRGAFEDVDKAVVALAASDLSIIPDDEAARRAFWIDVYNVLSQHAGRGRRSNRIWDVLELYRTEYQIAGVRLSLDDIEHGLLRDGAPHPSIRWAKMDPADPRRRLAVRLDPRVHFALNCGALSCPVIRRYRGTDLDEALEAATKTFLAAETHVDEAAGVIETSKLLSWYARDFGGREGVIALLARALDRQPSQLHKMSIRYKPYDWTNAIPTLDAPRRR
jgi:hypothetical protein